MRVPIARQREPAWRGWRSASGPVPAWPPSRCACVPSPGTAAAPPPSAAANASAAGADAPPAPAPIPFGSPPAIRPCAGPKNGAAAGGQSCPLSAAAAAISTSASWLSTKKGGRLAADGLLLAPMPDFAQDRQRLARQAVAPLTRQTRSGSGLARHGALGDQSVARLLQPGQPPFLAAIARAKCPTAA